jgi:2-keto-4-pentenoate hydratase/2-oxohepta-3-ene-1,7-dioic acid hydratase in catechol pathway
MKLVTFGGSPGDARLGALVGTDVIDLASVAAARASADAGLFHDALAFLRGEAKARDLAETLIEWGLARSDPGFVRALNTVSLLAPVPRPPKILCLAGNYAEHWREGGAEAPPKNNHTPEIFIKPVSTVIGPDAPIRLPGPICTAVDYEGELAVVIGRPARNVPVERALDYVAGYANYNDVSGRKLSVDVNRQPTARTGWFDWLNGKWFDTFGPLGPFVAIGEIAHPDELRVQTRVNGVVRQDASTGDMIFGIAETIAWISSFLTLEPGDVIATGTPSGVGATTGTYLRAGDVVEVEVEGLGVLRNPVANA